MQLFRQQAIDHRNRLHGEVFLVQPLRWRAIGWLLLAASCAAALFLIFGAYSDIVTARGTLQPAGDGWRAELAVPAARRAGLSPGQEVRVALNAYPVASHGVLRGVVEHVGAAPVDPVTVRLDPLTALQEERGILLRPGLPLEGRVVLGRRSLLRGLIDP